MAAVASFSFFLSFLIASAASFEDERTRARDQTTTAVEAFW